jgi:hypothetical protein
MAAIAEMDRLTLAKALFSAKFKLFTKMLRIPFFITFSYKEVENSSILQKSASIALRGK